MTSRRYEIHMLTEAIERAGHMTDDVRRLIEIAIEGQDAEV